MSGVLIDSDVIIEVLRERKPVVIRTWVDIVNGDKLLFYSPVSLAEIRHGMRESEKESIERVFSGMRCVPIEVEIASRAGDYLRAFHASHAVALGDALIAATASLHQLDLWTQNRKHFPMRDVHFLI
jgi:predicted nucleic acid-binding protein